ncbi:MAG: helix-turn-helix domain-containing protein [Rhodospirillales bacterium]|nr:helix-turn-helix domain-containing protein [Rhodospirillales bacterium]MCB9972985.1 helix-turn-helix domain-containing protein [Rhodospirillales bacterium]MCB9980027.1 helix-turn-helix domain-containing protein [Rhodospirillales bacterium]
MFRKKDKPEDPIEEQKEDLPTNLSVGEILRRARIASGKTVDEIETEIRIRASLLESLENMELEKLPGWVYTLGFVRTYSEYLDLDGHKMQLLLKAQVGDGKRQKLNFPAIMTESAVPGFWVVLSATVGLLVLIATIFIIQGLSADKNVIHDIPPPPASAKKALPVEPALPETPPVVLSDLAEEEAPPAEQVTDPDIEFPPPAVLALRDDAGRLLPVPRPLMTAAARTNDGEVAADAKKVEYRIVLEVTEDSWVEIKNSAGAVIVSRVLKAGDRFFVPNEEQGLTMTTGNLGGIDIFVDGEKISTKANSGDIYRDLPLEPESLKEMFP